MAAPTGHMACAVCLAPSVSVRRSTVASRVFVCHCSFAGAYAASRALVLATNTAETASESMSSACGGRRTATAINI